MPANLPTSQIGFWVGIVLLWVVGQKLYTIVLQMIAGLVLGPDDHYLPLLPFCGQVLAALTIWFIWWGWNTNQLERTSK